MFRRFRPVPRFQLLRRVPLRPRFQLPRRVPLLPRFQLPRRLRLLRILKWTGTLACLLILAAFVTSAWYQVRYVPDVRAIMDIRVEVVLDRAQVFLAYALHGGQPFPETITSGVDSHRFHVASGLFHQSSWGSVGSVTVPLWIPFVIALAPTLLLWRLDRRRVPPGHCRECRYNLAGNTTGRCPECGAPFAPAAR